MQSSQILSPSPIPLIQDAGAKLESVLASWDEKEIRKGIRDTLRCLWRFGNDLSIMVELDGEDVCLFTRDDKGKTVLKGTQTDGEKERRMVRMLNTDTDVEERIISAVAITKRNKVDQDLWYVSSSRYYDRVRSLINHVGIQNNRYIPSIFKVQDRGVTPNIRKAFLRHEVKSRMDKIALELQSKLGTPLYDKSSTLKRDVIFSTNINDSTIRDQLRNLRHYIVFEKKLNDERKRAFRRIVKKIAEVGYVREDMLDMVKELSDNKDRTRPKTFRIGAFIPNANIVLEYTRARAQSNKAGWFPLKYDKNGDGHNVLLPLKEGLEDGIAMTLFYTKIDNLLPKIICLLKDSSGKKIVNGDIYDMDEVRKHLKIEAKVPTKIKSIFQRSDIKYTLKPRSTSTQKKKEINTNSQQEQRDSKPQRKLMKSLPVTVMMDSEEFMRAKSYYRGTMDESEDDHPDMLNVDDIVSEDGDVYNEVIETQNNEDSHELPTIIKDTQIKLQDSQVLIRDTNSNKKSLSNEGLCLQQNNNNITTNDIHDQQSEKSLSTPLELLDFDTVTNLDVNFGNFESDVKNSHLLASPKTLNSTMEDSVNHCASMGDCDISSVIEDAGMNGTLKDKNSKSQFGPSQNSNAISHISNNSSNVENILVNSLDNLTKNDTSHTENGAAIDENRRVLKDLETNRTENELSIQSTENTQHTEEIEEVSFCRGTQCNVESHMQKEISQMDYSVQRYEGHVELLEIESEDRISQVNNMKNIGSQEVVSDINTCMRDCENQRELCKNSEVTDIHVCRDMTATLKTSILGHKIDGNKIRNCQYSTHKNADRNPIAHEEAAQSNACAEGSGCPYVVVKELKSGVINIIVRVERQMIEGRNIQVDIQVIDRAINDGETAQFKCSEFEGMRNAEGRAPEISAPVKNLEKNQGKPVKSKKKHMKKCDRAAVKAVKGRNAINSTNAKVRNGAESSQEKGKKRLNLYNETENALNMNSMWLNITNERLYYEPPPYLERNINSKDKRKFMDILRKGTARSNMCAMLNLPRRLEGKEKWIWGIGQNEHSKDSVYSGISRFYKGNYSKAFMSIMNKEQKEVMMTKEEVIKLFPRMSGEWKLTPIPNEKPDKRLIKTEEVTYILTSSMLPKGRATGASGLSYELIRKICKDDVGHAILTDMYNEILMRPDCMPQQMTMARLMGIEKPNGGTRPLCIQETLLKVMNKIMTLKVMEIIRDSLIGTQKCLARSEGQIMARDQVKGYIEDGFECIIQFDFSNAFGTINRKAIIDRLIHFNVKKTYINYIIYLLNNQKVSFTTDNGNEIIEIQTGVPQGEPMSMALFSLGIDKLLQEMDELDGVGITAYADDVIIAVRNADDVENIKKVFAEKSKEYGLSLNMDKTYIGHVVDITDGQRESMCREGGKVIDLRSGVISYVGLPITLDNNIELAQIKMRISKTIETSKMLWEADVPLQVKYHLQRICVDTELDYILRATPWSEEMNGPWLKEMQNNLYKLWEPISEIVPKHFLRLPVKYYGLGMLNIKDRWRVIRKAYENRMMNKKEDETLLYYKAKVRKWSLKGYMQNLNIEMIPSKVNTSLSAPPASNQHRLSNEAFRLMCAMRYNSEGLDHYFCDLDLRKDHCPHHPETEMTLQHIISCPNLHKRYVIEQHDRMVRLITAIIRRRKGVKKVKMESYSEKQQKQVENGQKGHRADITYRFDKVKHSIDVVVTSSDNDNCGNNVTRAFGAKEREYGIERNLHIVLFDTSGNIMEESYRFLTTLGVRSSDLRTMQRIIYECTKLKVDAVIEDAKYSN